MELQMYNQIFAVFVGSKREKWLYDKSLYDWKRWPGRAISGFERAVKTRYTLK